MHDPLDNVIFILSDHVYDELTKTERRIADVLLLAGLLYKDETPCLASGRSMAILRPTKGGKCPLCDSGTLHRVVEHEDYEAEGRKFHVEAVPRERCDRCGKDLFSAAACKQIDAALKPDRKRLCLGTFATREDAAQAYDNYFEKLHGERPNHTPPGVPERVSITVRSGVRKASTSLYDPHAKRRPWTEAEKKAIGEGQRRAWDAQRRERMKRGMTEGEQRMIAGLRRAHLLARTKGRYGVYHHVYRGMHIWSAVVRKRCIGSYNSAEEAAQAYDNAVFDMGGGRPNGTPVGIPAKRPRGGDQSKRRQPRGWAKPDVELTCEMCRTVFHVRPSAHRQRKQGPTGLYVCSIKCARARERKQKHTQT